MKLKPWNPVRVVVNATIYRCDHCGSIGGIGREMTVQGFMRALRKFEREHNSCAPAARMESAGQAAEAVVDKAMCR